MPSSVADFTMIGTIASLASGSKKHASPMKVEVNRFVKIIGIQVGADPAGGAHWLPASGW